MHKKIDWTPSITFKGRFIENSKYFEAKARRMAALAEIISQCDEEDIAIIKRNLEP
jgi:hypothetical protein